MSALLPTTAHLLLARAARAQRESRLPSLLTGVVRDGSLTWSAARGAVDEPHTDVQYRIGSITEDGHRDRRAAIARPGAALVGDPAQRQRYWARSHLG